MRLYMLLTGWLGLLALTLPPVVQGAGLVLPILKAGLPVVVAGITLTTLKIAAGVALLVKEKLLKSEEPTYIHAAPAYGYHKRSTTQETWGEEVVELEKLLVSAASRLDTDGCVLKLLCHLNNKQAHARTLEENVLLQLFSNNPDTLSFYHATFDNTAADVSKTQEQVATAACDKVFSSCTLGQEELSSLLQHTWPCPNITP
ncbi:uncharacterized protein [Panulirus ornatus]|uniref:uncharacterized protein n=1 Tax=Panulirus ornatus TaxID=150431 RepID=UPI003A8A602B